MSAAILFGSMAVMIVLGIPIAIVLGVSSALTLIFSGAPLGVIPSMMQATVQKFSLLTIPLSVHDAGHGAEVFPPYHPFVCACGGDHG